MAEQTQLAKTSEFTGFLKSGEAKPIFDEVIKSSVVQALTRQVPVGADGVEILAATGKPEAKWIAEGERKPFTPTSLGIKTTKPHKVAYITVASAEVVRVNPGGYIDIYKKQVAEAMAVVLDKAALYGGDPLDIHTVQAQKLVVLGTSDKGMYGDLITGLDLLLKAEKKFNGFVFDTASETMFLNELDTNKRPILMLGEVTGAPALMPVGRLLGRPTRLVDAVENITAKTIGFDGDWSKCAWGVTPGLSYRISTEAVVTVNDELASASERNLVAIVTEIEFAWLCANSESLVVFEAKG